MRLEQELILKKQSCSSLFFILIETCALFHDKIESKKNAKEIPMNVSVPIPGHSYDIVIERGGLNQVGDWLRTLWGDKKVIN